MQVINNERVVYFDVDKTLVLDAQGGVHDIKVYDPYQKRYVLRTPHYPHVRLLQNYHARGFHVVVWSKNGFQWAKSVINALDLEKHVAQVQTKPCIYVDDEKPESWIGESVFISESSSFGRD